MEPKSPRSSEARRRLASGPFLPSLLSSHGWPIVSTSFFLDVESERSRLLLDWSRLPFGSLGSLGLGAGIRYPSR